MAYTHMPPNAISVVTMTLSKILTQTTRAFDVRKKIQPKVLNTDYQTNPQGTNHPQRFEHTHNV